MKIIHGNDFYDSAIAFGIDEKITFVRQKDKIIEDKNFGIKKENKSPYSSWYTSKEFELENIGNDVKFLKYYNIRNGKYNFYNENFEFNMEYVKIYFCGKLYNGVCYTKTSKPIRNNTPYITENFFFYDFDSFSKFIGGFGLKVRNDKKYKYHWQKTKTTSEEETKKYFEEQCDQNTLDWLINNKITIAIRKSKNDGREYYWQIDSDELKNYQFAKVLDPYSTFQELSMWMGNVLTNNGQPSHPKPKHKKPPAIVGEVPNDVKITKHGFDNWSFRRMGPKSKVT